MREFRDMSDLTGKVILVTGAAGDIGHAIAEAFLKLGAVAIISDMRADELARRRQALAVCGEVEAIVADLAESGAPERLAREALDRRGRIDVLVNNAAIQHDGDAEDCDPEAFDRAYLVNQRAPFLLCRALIPGMRSAGGGAIINVGSVHASAPGPRRLAYATTKTALIGLTRSIAVDHGRHGIRANVLSPGATMTSQLREAWGVQGEGGDKLEYARRQHPLRRIAEVADIAAAAVFLAQSEFVTGTELRVDGGLLSSLRLLPARE